MTLHWKRDQQTFSIKSQRANILDVADQMVSVASPRLCDCSKKAAIDDPEINGCVCVPKNLHFQKQAVGCIWPTGYSLSTPDLENQK